MEGMFPCASQEIFLGMDLLYHRCSSFSSFAVTNARHIAEIGAGTGAISCLCGQHGQWD